MQAQHTLRLLSLLLQRMSRHVPPSSRCCRGSAWRMNRAPHAALLPACCPPDHHNHPELTVML